MMGRKPCRLAILASHPIQYFTPVYRLLAQHPDIDVEVLYCRDFGVRPRFDKQFGRAVQWDTDQLSGYKHRFLRNLSPVTDTFNPLHAINPGAFVRLLSGFDALWVNGYVYPSNWLAAAAGAVRGTRLLLRSELRVAASRSSRWFDGVRDRIIREWVRRSDALLFIGEENRRAYLAYGAKADKMFFVPYSVDVEALAGVAHRGGAARDALRDAWGVPRNAVVVLFVGKLTVRKHPEAVLRLGVPGALANAHVVIAGSGPLESQLRAEAQSLGTTAVTFLGFVNQAQLAEVYAMADVFVMPSEREPWGLVLNEAMAAGLAPVVSRDVGAAADLVSPDETGMLFDVGRWDAMEAHVRRLVSDRDLRARIGRAAQQRSARYSYAATTQGIVDALGAVGALGTSRHAASLHGAARHGDQ
jgi:glycosyltransferase involved in cell wall biosynthesis